MSSLDLALTAGVNFPLFLLQEAQQKEILYADTFEHIRYQWLLNGELFHFLERPRNFFAILADLFRSKNDLWLSDPLPAFFQLSNIFVHYYKKWRS